MSNGLLIPQGATIVTPQWQIHHDRDIYSHADDYIPYRFYDAGNDQKPNGRSATTTSIEYLPFGHGRHAWYAQYSQFGLQN